MSLTRRDGVPDYAARFAAAGLVAFAFDYRFWGDSDGEPRQWFSVRRQLEDWRAAVDAARAFDGVDPGRIAVWGMSLGRGHALHIAQTDRRIAAAVALLPMTDGLPLALAPAPPKIVLGLMARALREAIGRRPVVLRVAGAPGELAALVAPEALPGFTRLAAANGWRNEMLRAIRSGALPPCTSGLADRRASAAGARRERRSGAAGGDREDRGASTSRRAQRYPID